MKRFIIGKQKTKMTKRRTSKITKQIFKKNTPSEKFLLWATKKHKKATKRTGSSKKKYSLNKKLFKKLVKNV